MIFGIGLALLFLSITLYVIFIDGKQPRFLLSIVTFFLGFMGITAMTASIIILSNRYLP